METEKKLEDFKNTQKDAKKLDQIKGGGPGGAAGAKLPPDDGSEDD